MKPLTRKMKTIIIAGLIAIGLFTGACGVCGGAKDREVNVGEC